MDTETLAHAGKLKAELDFVEGLRRELQDSLGTTQIDVRDVGICQHRFAGFADHVMEQNLKSAVHQAVSGNLWMKAQHLRIELLRMGVRV